MQGPFRVWLFLLNVLIPYSRGQSGTFFFLCTFVITFAFAFVFAFVVVFVFSFVFSFVFAFVLACVVAALLVHSLCDAPTRGHVISHLPSQGLRMPYLTVPRLFLFFGHELC